MQPNPHFKPIGDAVVKVGGSCVIDKVGQLKCFVDVKPTEQFCLSAVSEKKEVEVQKYKVNRLVSTLTFRKIEGKEGKDRSSVEMESMKINDQIPSKYGRGASVLSSNPYYWSEGWCTPTGNKAFLTFQEDEKEKEVLVWLSSRKKQ